MEIFEKLPEAVLPWYRQNGRDLPWRKTKDAYPVWLSEIMLQQTRVEAVKGYYARFLEALPTIRALAECDDERLCKLWEGLGYYSRVRNLKKAAQIIMERHGGEFPSDYAQILALPGIGEYTAGAVASIAFGQKRAAVDGNVLRVAARLMADPSPIDTPGFKKRVTQRLESIYPEDAGDFTQALMELGATVCGPNRSPNCDHCPCGEFCLGHLRGCAAELPVKTPKKEKKQEIMTVLVLSCDGQYALRKRPDKGLLAGLWEFPHVPGHLSAADALELLRQWGMEPRDIRRQMERSHIFTHIRWDMRCFYVEVRDRSQDLVWMEPVEIVEMAALPTAFRLFWEEMDHV